MSDELIAILLPLGEDGEMDESDKKVVDISYRVAQKKISDDAKFKTVMYIASARLTNLKMLSSFLESISSKAVSEMLEYGIDDSAMDYISVVASKWRGISNRAFFERR